VIDVVQAQIRYTGGAGLEGPWSAFTPEVTML
jgi:hypothetical protein